MPLVEVTISDNPATLGKTEFQPEQNPAKPNTRQEMENDALCALAGPKAEGKYVRALPGSGDTSNQTAHGATDDYMTYLRAIDAGVDGVHIKETANRMVDDYWPVIKAVACVLLRDRKIDAARIRAIVAETR
jgi:hypothetical protein